MNKQGKWYLGILFKNFLLQFVVADCFYRQFTIWNSRTFDKIRDGFLLKRHVNVPEEYYFPCTQCCGLNRRFQGRNAFALTCHDSQDSYNRARLVYHFICIPQMHQHFPHAIWINKHSIEYVGSIFNASNKKTFAHESALKFPAERNLRSLCEFCCRDKCK